MFCLYLCCVRHVHTAKRILFCWLVDSWPNTQHIVLSTTRRHDHQLLSIHMLRIFYVIRDVSLPPLIMRTVQISSTRV